MSGRERVFSTLENKPRNRVALMPITMTFAARQIGALYHDYVTDARVLAEAQIRTAEKFGFDFVSCISDPTREAHDCGAPVEFWDDAPPTIDDNNVLLGNKAILLTLRIPDVYQGRMGDRVLGVQLLQEKVGRELFIEGWVEGPVAEAADLRGLNTLMFDFFDDEIFVRDLLAFCCDMSTRFAHAQVEAGADIIGVGDAAASLLGPEIYEEFVWPYEKQLVDAIHEMGARARLHICGNIAPLLPKIAELGCDIVDVDFLVPMSQAREIRNGTPQSIRHLLAQCHAIAGEKYILGAGCEIPRDTPEENVRALYEYSQEAAS
jgi:MtaA/CmuA family methyltransferase